jgi:ferrous iron transport protein A
MPNLTGYRRGMRSFGVRTAGEQPLGSVALGSEATLVGLHLADATRLRLTELGLRPGAVVRVLSRTPGGGRVIGLGAGRVAVDRATAKAVTVSLAR